MTSMRTISPVESTHAQTDKQKQNGERQGNFLEKMLGGGTNDQGKYQKEQAV